MKLLLEPWRNAPGLYNHSYPERRTPGENKRGRLFLARMGKCWCHGLHGPEAMENMANVGGHDTPPWLMTSIVYIYGSQDSPIHTYPNFRNQVCLPSPFKFISIYSWKIKIDHGQNTLQEAWIGSGNITMPAKNKVTKVPIQGLQSLPNWNNHMFWLLQVYTPTEVIIGHISIILPRLSGLYRQYISTLATNFKLVKPC